MVPVCSGERHALASFLTPPFSQVVWLGSPCSSPPTHPLSSWGSQVPGPGWHFLWSQKPQRLLRWASASVGLARGGWSLGAGATAAPARLCYRGCPCPQSLPSARRKPRWQVVWGEDVQVAVTGTSIEPEARETGRLEPSSVAFLLGPALLLSTVQLQEAAVAQCPWFQVRLSWRLEVIHVMCV